jgi:hypothetical protein
MLTKQFVILLLLSGKLKLIIFAFYEFLIGVLSLSLSRRETCGDNFFRKNKRLL